MGIVVALDRARELRAVSIAWAREQDIEGLAWDVARTLGQRTDGTGLYYYRDEIISIRMGSGIRGEVCEIKVCGQLTYQSSDGGRVVSVARPGRWMESLRKLALAAQAQGEGRDTVAEARAAHNLLERFAPLSAEG